MNKKVFLLLTLTLFSISLSSISAQDFQSNVLDSGTVYGNPILKIDSNGIIHVVYSKMDSLIYMNSADNYTARKIISEGQGVYSRPTMTIDSNNIIHIAFKLNSQVNYVNSKDWIIKNIGIGSENFFISITSDSNNKIFIASENSYQGYDLDIVLASSTDYENFQLNPIHKVGSQMNPVLNTFNNIVHLIYFDWSDGIGTNQNGEGVGLYKTRYSNSLDNFTSQENISIADRSYDADMDIDNDGNIWVVFKDSTEDYTGQEFESGMIWLADRNSNWNKQLVQNLTKFMQDRPLAISIGEDNGKHISWSQLDNNHNVYIMYGRINSPVTVTLKDVGFNPDLGYVTIDTLNNTPYIIANIHSLADYEFLPEIPSPSPEFLQSQINNLTIKLNELQERYNQLNNRTTYLERVINALFVFLHDFKVYFDSPQECINGQKRCSTDNLQICTNYQWVQNQICQYGCSNNACNPPPKENCLLKTPTNTCSSRYSAPLIWSCKSGQGTNTQCNLGQCISRTSYSNWIYCRNGCNSSTGLCI